jgi:hypothetical protein
VGLPRSLVLLLFAAVGLAGCQAPVDAQPTEATTQPSRRQEWQGPAPIQDVELSTDRRQAFVRFIGAKEFAADDPCSAKYHGTTAIEGDELVIGIYSESHPLPLPNGTACAGVGYLRSITLELAEPFMGVRVHDLWGQRIELAAPAGSAD